MIIDFKNMEEQILPNFKGGEKAYAVKKFTDDRNMIMHGRLVSGASIGLHTHEGNCEMFYIIEGTGKVLMDGEYERVEAGVCHYCPKGHTHSLINDSDSDLVFFAIVKPSGKSHFSPSISAVLFTVITPVLVFA